MLLLLLRQTPGFWEDDIEGRKILEQYKTRVRNAMLMRVGHEVKVRDAWVHNHENDIENDERYVVAWGAIICRGSLLRAVQFAGARCCVGCNLQGLVVACGAICRGSAITTAIVIVIAISRRRRCRRRSSSSSVIITIIIAGVITANSA